MSTILSRVGRLTSRPSTPLSELEPEDVQRALRDLREEDDSHSQVAADEARRRLKREHGHD
jgi:DNA topoisomerase IA